MTQSVQKSSTEMTQSRGELFSLLLRLHPIEAGQVAPGAGNQVQAAFLDMVRQGDPALSEWLHAPNQRRPYSVGLLQGFNHLTPEQLEEARTKQQTVSVLPGQTYCLLVQVPEQRGEGGIVMAAAYKRRIPLIKVDDVVVMGEVTMTARDEPVI